MLSSRFRLLFAAAAIACIAACDPQSLTSSGTSTNGQISWLVRDQEIEVTNETQDTLRYTVVGRNYYHTNLGQFCFGSPTCSLQLPPALTGVLSYIDIPGSAKPETQAMIIWWKQSATTVPFDTVIVQIR
jgi:hypothetical protein